MEMEGEARWRGVGWGVAMVVGVARMDWRCLEAEEASVLPQPLLLGRRCFLVTQGRATG